MGHQHKNDQLWTRKSVLFHVAFSLIYTGEKATDMSEQRPPKILIWL